MNTEQSSADSRHLTSAATLAMLLFALLSLWGCNTNEQPASAVAPPPDKEKVAPLYSFNGEILLEGTEEPIGIMVFVAGSSHLAFTDAQGQYTIPGIEAGEHIIMAQHPHFLSARIAEVVIDGDETNEAISLPPIRLQPDTWFRAATTQPTDEGSNTAQRDGMGILAGNVSVPEGELVEAVRVVIEELDVAVNPNASGRFLMTNIRPGDYDVDFELDGHDLEIRRVRIIGGHMAEIPETVVMTPSDPIPAGNGSIMGKVLILGPDGSVVEPSLKVRVSIVETAQTVMASNELDFFFQDLARGDYTIVAEATGYSLQKPVTVTLTDEIENAVLIMEEEKGILTGIVTLAGGDGSNLAGSQVAVTGTAFSAITDTKGTFRMEGIPAGTHSVVCLHSDYEALEISDVKILPSQTTDLGTIELQSGEEAPIILAITPEDGTRDLMIEPENDFQIIFSKRMNIEAVRNAITIQPECSFSVLRTKGELAAEGGNDIIIARILNGKSPAPLQFKTRYTLTVAKEATDTQGIALKEGARVGFQTGGLMVMSTYPQAGIDNVPIVGNTRLVVYFNGLIDEKTMSSQRCLNINPNPLVQATNKEFRRDPRTGWTIFYNVPVTWEPNTDYTIKLESSIKATDGTALVPYRFKFRTEPEKKFENL